MSRWRDDPRLAQSRGRGLRRADFEGLRALGIPGRLTAWPSPSGADIILRDAVVFRRSARFSFARDLQGEDVEPVTAYTVVARDRLGAPLDVVAWHPRTGRLASWLGRAGLIGEDFPSPATADDPLIVYPDLGAWLAADRRGVVVVHDRLARPALLEAGVVQAADIAHGEALQAMLREVKLPRIVVPALPDVEAA